MQQFQHGKSLGLSLSNRKMTFCTRIMYSITFGYSVTNAKVGGKHRQEKFQISNPLSFKAIHVHQDRIYVSYTCYRSTHSLVDYNVKRKKIINPELMWQREQNSKYDSLQSCE